LLKVSVAKTVAKRNEAVSKIIVAPESMGQMINFLFSFKILKLSMDIFHPLERRERVLIMRLGFG